MKKAFLLSTGFIFFSLLNQMIDFFICSKHLTLSVWLAIYMHASVGLVLRGVFFNLMHTYPLDWILDNGILLTIYAFIFNIILKIKNYANKN